MTHQRVRFVASVSFWVWCFIYCAGASVALGEERPDPDGRNPTVKTELRRTGKAPLPGAVGSRYANPEYRRPSSVQPLREIVNLPNVFVDDLNKLIKEAVAQSRIKPDVNTEGLKVKYFRGVNHSHHGLLENGVGEIGGEPPTGTYVTEHCFDDTGTLVKAIGRKADGTRTVSRKFLYEGGRPACMLTYNSGAFAFGDLGVYHGENLILVARIDGEGKVLSCECMLYAEDREDYSVRYVAKQTTDPFALADLRMESIQLNGMSTLKFDETGGLKDLWLFYPPKPQ